MQIYSAGTHPQYFPGRKRFVLQLRLITAPTKITPAAPASGIALFFHIRIYAPMNAIIIDDHPLARIAIRNLLDSNGITVAAELDSGAHAVQTAETMQPDLLIVDVDIPELSGIDVLEQLRKRRYRGKIIVISAKNELFYGKRSADCGANGFVSKKEGMNNILAAIDAANNGYSYFPFSLERFCTHGITDQDRLDTLSTQEMKVFRYILSGIDYTTIGSKMNISNKTVSTYKVRLMDKLGCSSLLELYDFAQRNKIG
jgi:two-component system response regulator EvgA